MGDVTPKIEIRSVIKFCVGCDMTPQDTLKFISRNSMTKNVSRSLVYRWYKRFSDGETEITDQQRSGRPKSDVISSVTELIQHERRLSVRAIGDTLDMPKSSVHLSLTYELNMSKVAARWVPRLLKDHEKEKRVNESKAFIKRYEREGDNFLNRIITTDETWLYLYEPESKRESMVWKHVSSPPPKKARRSRSMKKYMFIFFIDHDGLLLQHAVPQGRTVNAHYYQKAIRVDLMKAIRRKLPGTEPEDFIYHQDNAPAHRAENTQMTIDFLGFERLQHAPYSPHLAPCDFSFFPRLKSDLRGKRFNDLEELCLSTRSVIRTYESSWYNDMYQKWIHRHRKCVLQKGSYFEKE